MKSKLMIAALIAIQVITLSSAVAQGGDDQNKKPTAKEVQDLRDKAFALKDIGGSSLGVGAALAGATKLTYNSGRRLLLRALGPEEFEAIVPKIEPDEKFIYGIAATMAAIGVVTGMAGEHYDKKAANLNLTKSLPAEPVGSANSVTGDHAGTMQSHQ